MKLGYIYAWLMIVLVWILPWGSAFSEEESGGDVISQVEINGNLKVEKDAILQVMKNKEGARFDLRKIFEDIESIYDLGYFSDVKIYKKKYRIRIWSKSCY